MFVTSISMLGWDESGVTETASHFDVVKFTRLKIHCLGNYN